MQARNENVQFPTPHKQTPQSVQKQAFGEMKNVTNSTKDNGHLKVNCKANGGTPSNTSLQQQTQSAPPFWTPKTPLGNNDTPLRSLSKQKKPKFIVFDDADVLKSPKIVPLEGEQLFGNDIDFFDMIDFQSHENWHEKVNCKANGGTPRQPLRSLSKQKKPKFIIFGDADVLKSPKIVPPEGEQLFANDIDFFDMIDFPSHENWHEEANSQANGGTPSNTSLQQQGQSAQPFRTPKTLLAYHETPLRSLSKQKKPKFLIYNDDADVLKSPKRVTPVVEQLFANEMDFFDMIDFKCHENCCRANSPQSLEQIWAEMDSTCNIPFLFDETWDAEKPIEESPAILSDDDSFDNMEPPYFNTPDADDDGSDDENPVVSAIAAPTFEWDESPEQTRDSTMMDSTCSIPFLFDETWDAEEPIEESPAILNDDDSFDNMELPYFNTPDADDDGSDDENPVVSAIAAPTFEWDESPEQTWAEMDSTCNMPFLFDETWDAEEPIEESPAILNDDDSFDNMEPPYFNTPDADDDGSDDENPVVSAIAAPTYHPIEWDDFLNNNIE